MTKKPYFKNRKYRVIFEGEFTGEVFKEIGKFDVLSFKNKETNESIRVSEDILDSSKVITLSGEHTRTDDPDSLRYAVELANERCFVLSQNTATFVKGIADEYEVLFNAYRKLQEEFENLKAHKIPNTSTK